MVLRPTKAAALAAALALGSLAAQPCPPVPPLGTVAVDARSGVLLNLGVQFLGGEYFVSGTGGRTTGPWEIFVFDAGFNLVRRFPQPAAVTSGFGLRDGATDGTALFFGNELGIFGFDTSGNPVTTVQAANGPQTVAFPITGPGLASNFNYRALAFDPDGNGGNGSFFTGDYSRDILEIDLAGNILNTLANDGRVSAYGLAYDGDHDLLWVSDDGSNGIVPLDATTGAQATLPVLHAPGDAGGLSFGRNFAELVALTQSTPDRVELLYSPGPLAVVTGIDGGPRSPDAKELRSYHGTLELAVTGNVAPGPALVAYFVNVGAEARQCGSVAFLGRIGNSLRNFTRLTNFTMPGSPAFLSLPATSADVLSIPTASILGQIANGPVQIQALYIDGSPAGGRFPARATNDATVLVDDTARVGVVVAADGQSSFDLDTSRGFFSVQNFATDPNKAITSLTFDLRPVGNLEFDCDQGGMSDAFWNGNATGPGACGGTYRNGSALAAGLDHTAAQVNLRNPACSTTPAENAGCEARNQVGTAPTYRTLTWRFTGGSFLGGVRFEFDLDTDNGTTTGAAHAGMVVTVTFADGTMVSGPLQAVGALRAEVVL